MLRVFVALGKQTPKCKAMIEDTENVAKLLAKYNCTLVQGGAKTGLMGTVLGEFQKFSDDVVLIVPEVHKADLEGTVSKEHYIVEGEADRLKITINTCDIIVVLPGGTGTMAELNYYNETCKSGEHNAKIVMINTKGYYNKFLAFIKHQIKMGFMKKEDFKFEVVNSAKMLEPIIKSVLTQKQDKLVIEEPKEELVEDMKQVAKVKKLPVKPKNKTTVTKINKSSSTKKSSSKSTEKTTKKTTAKAVTEKKQEKPFAKKVAKPVAKTDDKKVATAKRSASTKVKTTSTKAKATLPKAKTGTKATKTTKSKSTKTASTKKSK